MLISLGLKTWYLTTELNFDYEPSAFFKEHPKRFQIKEIKLLCNVKTLLIFSLKILKPFKHSKFYKDLVDQIHQRYKILHNYKEFTK